MSDLEERLSRALAEGAEEAPDAGQLAAAARSRAAARRRRRVSAGVAVAVLAVFVPIALDRGETEREDAGVTEAPRDDGWQSVSELGVTLDLPPGWVSLDASECPARGPGPLHGPMGTDPCADPDTVPAAQVFDYPVDFDSLPGLGPDGGHVSAGDAGVVVFGVERDVARRILASARPTGEPAPAVESWTTLALEAGITSQVPEGSDVEVQVSGIPRCMVRRSPAEPLPGDRWRARLCRERIVDVNAPTQALADVVASTVRGY